MKALAALWLSLLLLLTGCSSDEKSQPQWVEDEVSFDADGLTIHGTYRHQKDAAPGPAALLISESGNTDRNGDNIVVGKIGNMRQLAELLSDRGEASLRYDKIGTGKTGLGPFQQRPNEVGSAVYTSGAKAAARYLADQSGTDKQRISVYAVGEGAVHAMALASDTSPGSAEGPLAGPAPAAVRSLSRHHHQPGALRRQPRDAEHLAGRRRRGPHQGHRAQGAARGPRRDPQPRQREGHRGGRQDRPGGAGRRHPRGHAGAAVVLGHRPPGALHHA